MRTTWIAVLAGAMSIGVAGVRAEDSPPAPRQSLKILPSGLPSPQAAQPPELLKTPADTTATNSANGVALAAPSSQNGAPPSGGACATPVASCARCGPSHLSRLKEWLCYRSTSGCLCSHTCCNGQRWVPLYLFFLTPCVEGHGVPSCATAVTPCQAGCPTANAVQPASAREGGAGTCSPDSGRCRVSGFFADLGHRLFGAPRCAASR